MECIKIWRCCNAWGEPTIMCDKCLTHYYDNMSDYEDDRNCMNRVEELKLGDIINGWIWDGQCSCGNSHPNAGSLYTPIQQKDYIHIDYDDMDIPF